MTSWSGVSTRYGLYAGLASLIVVGLGLWLAPMWILILNIPLFLVLTGISMFLMARNINSQGVFIGFNNMLKPLMRTFVIALLIFYLGFMLLEYGIFTDLNNVRTELSLRLLDRFSSFFDSNQYEILQEGIEKGRQNSGFSITGLVVSLALYFAVFGLPMSIFVAAVVNRGFSNEEKISRK